MYWDILRPHGCISARTQKTHHRKGELPLKSLSDLWDSILARLSGELSDMTIKTWFDEITVVTMEDSALVLHCSNPFKKNTVEARFLPHIKAALKDIFSTDLEVKILSDEQLAAYHGVAPDRPGNLFDSDAFTFETYVVGPQNKLAYAAAKAVAEKPAEGFNPLFIYGESGLGKTHLLYAIANSIHQNKPGLSVVYVKGDTFTNELIQAIREGRNQEFRDKYRSADIFLMDDVQFVAGRASTQEEMFHTFNTLYEAKRQIVFTSDRPPKEMLRLDDRLKTRFEWGLLADIQPPDYETRMAIIKNKSIRMGIELPEFLLQLIAENITANVRQIEGTVNKIMAYQDLMGDTVDKDTVVRAVKDMFKDKSDIVPTADVIIDEVCKFYNIEPDSLRGQGRTKDISLARQIAMYQIRRMTNLSLKEIGREFEGRDHTTVLHSIERIEKMVKESPETAEIIKDITANINIRYE